MPDLDSQRRFYDTRYRERPVELNIDECCRLRVIRKFLRAIHLKRGRILELGCGTGWLSQHLSRFGAVTAVDLSPEAIAIAKRRYPGIHFHAANVLEDHDLGGGYDLVVSSEVIEHLPKDQQPRLIALASQQLAPGGYLILTTPNRPVVERFIIPLDALQPIENWMTIAELRGLLTPQLRILTVRTTLLFQGVFRRHPKLNWLRGVAYRRLGGIVAEDLLGWTARGTYMCFLAQKPLS